MTPENRVKLLQLFDRHHKLGISEQIDYEKSNRDSLIASSASFVDLIPEPIVSEMVDNITYNINVVNTIYSQMRHKLTNKG